MFEIETYSTPNPDKRLELSSLDLEGKNKPQTQLIQTQLNDQLQGQIQKVKLKNKINQTEMEDCIKHVTFLMNHEEYDLSSHILNLVLKNDPTHAKALSLISVCFKATNKSSEIFFIIRRAIKSSTLSLETHLFYADLLLEHHFMSEAKSIYFSLLKSEEIKIEEKNKIKENFLKKTKNQKALFSIYKRIGDLYLEELNFKEAEKFYFKAKKIHPKNDTLMVRFGSLECKKQNFEKALFYFKEALNENAQNDLAWFGLSLLQRFYGDYELSWANLERALEINILNERALRACFLWARSDSCEERLIRILELAKKTQKDKEVKLRMSFLLGGVFYYLGQYKNSLSEVNEITRMGKKYKGALTLKVLLREAFKREGDFKDKNFIRWGSH